MNTFHPARKIVYRIYITSRKRFSIIGINDPSSDLVRHYSEDIFATKTIHLDKESAVNELLDLFLSANEQEKRSCFAPDMLLLLSKVITK